MKKRAMKKYIPKNTPYCYIIKRIEIRENGMRVLKCDYCGNRYIGTKIDDAIIGMDGTEYPIKRNRIMCRYINDELTYDDTKECGEGY